MDSVILEGSSNKSGNAGEQRGIVLVILSAVVWSFGGAIARYLDVDDTWTQVFWRSGFASVFLFSFLVWRDGFRGALSAFAQMGWPGFAVALCFGTASTSFVLALAHTTVANILLINAGVPLIAALLGWILFRTRVSGATWLAIAAVIGGVAIMVSESLDGKVSPIGDLLALTISFAFASATVITRHYAHVRMLPATCLGTAIGTAIAFFLSGGLAVSLPDFGLLFAFGALNLGLGLALFSSGARLVPAALAALLGTLETVLGPVWVWLFHGETASGRTLLGGLIVFAALFVHLALEWRAASRRKA